MKKKKQKLRPELNLLKNKVQNQINSGKLDINKITNIVLQSLYALSCIEIDNNANIPNIGMAYNTQKKPIIFNILNKNGKYYVQYNFMKYATFAKWIHHDFPLGTNKLVNVWKKYWEYDHNTGEFEIE